MLDIQSEIYFEEKELKLIQEIFSSLQPIKIAVETLCSKDTNLLTADIILKFMLSELSRQNNILSLQLKENLIEKINDRRTILSDVLDFLHSSENKDRSSSKQYFGIFNQTSHANLSKQCIMLLEQICQTDDELLEDEEDEIVIQPSPTKNDLSMNEKLHLLIKEKVSHQNNNPGSSLNNPNQKTLIKTELKLFSEQGLRGKNLELLY